MSAPIAHAGSQVRERRLRAGNREQTPLEINPGRSERLAASKGQQTLRSFRPSRQATVQRVGRSSDFRAWESWPSRRKLAVHLDTPGDNGSNQFPSITLGYSGGAVPDLHRSSLFCRPFQRETPDHQRTHDWQCSNEPDRCQTFRPRATKKIARRTQDHGTSLPGASLTITFWVVASGGPSSRFVSRLEANSHRPGS
jgi:hypothetical protein